MKPGKIQILFLDDDRDQLAEMGRRLIEGGITDFELFDNSKEMLDHVSDDTLAAMIDYRLVNEEVTGIDVVESLRKKNEHAYVSLLTGLQEDTKINNQKLIVVLLNVKADKYIYKDDEGKYLDTLVDEVKIGLEIGRTRYEERQNKKQAISELEKMIKKWQ